jgi:3-dehydroquinate dehydratase/shikimate dehydrogenase
MGEHGLPTRVLGPVVGNALNYSYPEESQVTAPGQIDLATLFTIYHYNRLNRDTKIYAVLGNPVSKSVSHTYHNEVFLTANKNAVYIKIKLNDDELKEFFQQILKLPFAGFSVTMPLKEKIIPFMDELSDDVAIMRAVNTIKIEGKKLIGFNTDGPGTLNAIEEKLKVKDKKAIIIGAGGAAKAIAYHAIKRGAKVIILNRTLTRAQVLAAKLNCQAADLKDMNKIKTAGYDILINATSVGMEGQTQTSPAPVDYILPGCLVLDMVSKPAETIFIKAARLKQCVCITGYDVFIHQAILQYKIWFREP